jgi:hypothetical protein
MDQVIFDSANVLYLAANLPEGAEERTNSESQTLWLIARDAALKAEPKAKALALIRSGRGAEVFAAREKRGSLEAQAGAALPIEMIPMAELMDSLCTHRAAFLAELATMPESTSEGEGNDNLMATLRSLVGHYFEHGLAMVELLPEFWDDGITLTWVLEADLSYDAVIADRRAALLSRIRAHHAAVGTAEAPVRKGRKL